MTLPSWGRVLGRKCSDNGFTPVKPVNEVNRGAITLKKCFDHLRSAVYIPSTYQCVGINKIVAGKPTGQGICKFMDKDGDFLVGEITSAGPEGTWKAFYGTGKWKGITGSGKYVYITNSKPIVNGTFQNCNRSTGTYELAK
jgi:hypothetical protein